MFCKNLLIVALFLFWSASCLPPPLIEDSATGAGDASPGLDIMAGDTISPDATTPDASGEVDGNGADGQVRDGMTTPDGDVSLPDGSYTDIVQPPDGFVDDSGLLDARVVADGSSVVTDGSSVVADGNAVDGNTGVDVSVVDGNLIVPDGSVTVADGNLIVPDASAPVDSGSIPPLTDVPGGPVGQAPIVGCQQADRPARRLSSAVEVCETQAPAKCWYVSPEGNDSDPGTFAAPFGTPQAAVRLAGPGDIIYLRGGVYTDTNSHDFAPVAWNDSTLGTRRGFISIRGVMLPGWAGGETYGVQSGTATHPITIRSFPEERACATGAGSIRIGAGSPGQEVAHWTLEGITLHRGAFLLGGGSRDDSGQLVNQTHDILIRLNEAFEDSRPGTSNPGLVKVDRGQWGGPYDIIVESNILHDILPIDPDGVVRDWQTTQDSQHFGAISMLSCERYIDPNCVGNGALTVRNNHIYHVPQAFFLKTPSIGPYHFYGNLIHDVGGLGGWVPSNITFEDNLVYNGGGARVGGHGSNYERNGHNLVFRNNTLIGMTGVLTFAVMASGHTVSGNVIDGLPRAANQGDWNHMGYIGQPESPYNPDTATDFASSQLAVNNDFDDNCFVTTTDNFLAFSRRYDVGSGVQSSYLGIAEARTVLGHEVTSDIVPQTSDAFVDFAGADYRINSSGPCAGRGAAVPAWAP